MTVTKVEQVFHLPDLGEGLAEAEILEWRVAVGDLVVMDQIVAEVETAKAAVEIPVPFAGRVSVLHGAAHDVIDVGKPLITVTTEREVDEEPVDQSSSSDSVPDASSNGDGPRDSRVLIGSGVFQSATDRRTRASLGAIQGSDQEPRVISPLVRKLALDNGIDIDTLAGTGPGGIIRRIDVEAAIAQKHAPLASTVAEPLEPELRIPLRGVRAVIADKLGRSRREIPDATTWVDVDATGLLEAKKVLQAAYPGHRIGVLPLLARICVAGLLRFPELNSTVDAEHGEIVQYRHINLGFAAQTPRGLLVPVIRNAHTLSTVQLADEIERLTEAAMTGRAGARDLTGGTFTLNNYGRTGTDGSTPIINYPEAAMVGVGQIIQRPWVVDGELAVRQVGQFCLAFDHRVCDADAAGGFLRFVADCVERPTILLGGL